jgi:hypothetical protein
LRAAGNVPTREPRRMYITQRQSGFRFQIRVPTDLTALLRNSPLRINFGPH